jgi:hypothetical protein
MCTLTCSHTPTSMFVLCVNPKHQQLHSPSYVAMYEPSNRIHMVTLFIFCEVTYICQDVYATVLCANNCCLSHHDRWSYGSRLNEEHFQKFQSDIQGNALSSKWCPVEAPAQLLKWASILDRLAPDTVGLARAGSSLCP